MEGSGAGKLPLERALRTGSAARTQRFCQGPPLGPELRAESCGFTGGTCNHPAYGTVLWEVDGRSVFHASLVAKKTSGSRGTNLLARAVYWKMSYDVEMNMYQLLAF